MATREGARHQLGLQGRPPAIYSDADVLEMRSRFEFEGWTRDRLLKEYGMSRLLLSKILSYDTHSKLVPKPPGMKALKPAVAWPT